MNKINIKSTGTYERTLEKIQKVPPIKMNDVEFKLELEPISSETMEKARIELLETEENVKKALVEIRELLKGEPELHVPDDDYFFAKFLRPCKWHSKPAFELMKRFYRFRIDHPQYFINHSPSANKNILSSGILIPFPSRTKNNCRVVLIQGGKCWNPKIVSLDEIFRGAMLLLDGAILEPLTQVSGVNVILDMDGLSLSQVTYFTPSFARAVLEWVQKCLPARVKGIHVINQPFIFNLVFAIFKPFFIEKLRKRLHFHGTNRQSLMSYIDAEALPIRYGGKLNIMEESFGETLTDYFCAFDEQYVEAQKYGYTTKNQSK